LKEITDPNLTEEDRLRRRVKMLEDAIEGWRKTDEEKTQKIGDLELLRIRLIETNNADLERRRKAESDLEKVEAVIDALATDIVRKGKLIAVAKKALIDARIAVSKANLLSNRKPTRNVLNELRANLVLAMKHMSEALFKEAEYERENRAD
jgi:hypothetical protein